jgi:UDP-glucoronosyl and UDP-glucosyl transferase
VSHLQVYRSTCSLLKHLLACRATSFGSFPQRTSSLETVSKTFPSGPTPKCVPHLIHSTKTHPAASQALSPFLNTKRPKTLFEKTLNAFSNTNTASNLADCLPLQVVGWVPQNDLLGHPKMRGYLCHGGMNSVSEVRGTRALSVL